ncbi:MAG TPA: chemotaxis protein CheA [Candidatus Sulfopaludibacter sp.]|nr:chemotaxis protein CheA [Candidatus Sulfopaludibacter sp.]
MTDKYKLAFSEEARELVVELESALLKLDADPQDQEVVGRAFRALHTIKGSGAMFGFDDIAGFAHHLETAFDRLRRGELTATSSLVNLALAASDQIKVMLDAASGSGQVDADRNATILEQLRQLSGVAEDPLKSDCAATPAGRVSPAGPAQNWRIRFRPSREMLLNGTNPALLIGELRAMGDLKLEADTSKVPLLAEMEPANCYLAWEMVLATTSGAEEIRDVFIFVEGDSEVLVEAAKPAVSQAEAATISDGRQQNSSLRVSVDKLDELVNLVGELVTVQARLDEVAARSDDPDVLEIAESVGRLTAALRENSISIRLLPLKSTFERFRRLVHDLGAELHKEVELTIEGAETELDKTVIDQLKDPLVHLIRNAMDHGIESPEARIAAGKPARARIHLSAEHSGANVLVRVGDDGRGLDVEAVRRRAVEQGLITADARLTEPEILSLILSPGFSTARTVTDISGRGVGMDVVRRSLETLRGSVEVESKPGAGLTVTLRLPLTLAIIDGLLVRVGKSHFVLPLANSLECVELTRQDIEESHGRHVANVRGRIIPYIRLSEYLRMATDRPEREQIMLMETEHGHYGFVVDQVLGDHQTVIKNLGRLYRNVQEVSGATILGNGSVALILDPERLVQSAVQSISQERSGLRRARQKSKFGQTFDSEGKQDRCNVK